MEMKLGDVFEDILNCKKCSLSGKRTQVVFDNEGVAPRIILVGEAPGGHEDTISGKPFTGRAGEQLNEFLNILKLNREDVYITNLVKCRPVALGKSPRYGKYKNRKPKTMEIKACEDYLKREIEIFSPEMIITLGNVPLSFFVKDKTIGKCHGTIIKVESLSVFPLYHPGSIVYNPKIKDSYLKDLKKLRDVLGGI